MSLFPLKPTSAHVKKYYAALAQFHLHGHTTEGNTRSAFADLLKRCCPPYSWHLVEEICQGPPPPKPNKTNKINFA